MIAFNAEISSNINVTIRNLVRQTRVFVLKVPRCIIIYISSIDRVIVPDEIHESYPGKNIYRKDPKFSDRSTGQTVQPVPLELA